MHHTDVPHFEEAGRRNPVTPADRMPAREYGIALDYLVFACVDIALTYQNQVLLAKRSRYPRKGGWWIVGGRMVAGESPLEAVARKVGEEAGLVSIDPDRFIYLGAYSTCFAKRDQEPAKNGSHSVNLTYQLELMAKEQSQLLLNDEYDDRQWVAFKDVKQLIDMENELDRALLKIVRDLMLAQS